MDSVLTDEQIAVITNKQDLKTPQQAMDEAEMTAFLDELFGHEDA